MFFSVQLWLNKTVLCISSWGFLSFAVAGFPKCLSWKMEPLVLTKRFNSNTGELKSGSRTGSRFMAWVCSCWASSRMTFNSFKNFILKVLVLTFLWEHHCSISSEQLLLLTGSGWAQSGLCSPDLQTPNALDYFTLCRGQKWWQERGQRLSCPKKVCTHLGQQNKNQEVSVLLFLIPSCQMS